VHCLIGCTCNVSKDIITHTHTKLGNMDNTFKPIDLTSSIDVFDKKRCRIVEELRTWLAAFGVTESLLTTQARQSFYRLSETHYSHLEYTQHGEKVNLHGNLFNRSYTDIKKIESVLFAGIESDRKKFLHNGIKYVCDAGKVSRKRVSQALFNLCAIAQKQDVKKALCSVLSIAYNIVTANRERRHVHYWYGDKNNGKSERFGDNGLAGFLSDIDAEYVHKLQLTGRFSFPIKASFSLYQYNDDVKDPEHLEAEAISRIKALARQDEVLCESKYKDAIHTVIHGSTVLTGNPSSNTFAVDTNCVTINTCDPSHIVTDFRKGMFREDWQALFYGIKHFNTGFWKEVYKLLLSRSTAVEMREIGNGSSDAIRRMLSAIEGCRKNEKNTRGALQSAFALSKIGSSRISFSECWRRFAPFIGKPSQLKNTKPSTIIDLDALEQVLLETRDKDESEVTYEKLTSEELQGEIDDMLAEWYNDNGQEDCEMDDPLELLDAYRVSFPLRLYENQEPVDPEEYERFVSASKTPVEHLRNYLKRIAGEEGYAHVCIPMMCDIFEKAYPGKSFTDFKKLSLKYIKTSRFTSSEWKEIEDRINGNIPNGTQASKQASKQAEGNAKSSVCVTARDPVFSDTDKEVLPSSASDKSGLLVSYGAGVDASVYLDKECSFFLSARNNTSEGEISVKEFCEIASGDNDTSEAVELYRKTKDKELKTSLPCVSMQCLPYETGKRSKENSKVNGLAVIDIDNVIEEHIPLWKELLIARPETVFVAASVSGKGLAVCIAYDTDSITLNEIHCRYNAILETDYAREPIMCDRYKIDTACRDESRLRFLTSDKSIAIKSGEVRPLTRIQGAQ